MSIIRLIYTEKTSAVHMTVMRWRIMITSVSVWYSRLLIFSPINDWYWISQSGYVLCTPCSIIIHAVICTMLDFTISHFTCPHDSHEMTYNDHISVSVIHVSSYLLPSMIDIEYLNLVMCFVLRALSLHMLSFVQCLTSPFDIYYDNLI